LQQNTRKRPTSGLMGNIEVVLGVVKKSVELGCLNPGDALCLLLKLSL